MGIEVRYLTHGDSTETTGPQGYPDDQFYLLKLCLELQLEALLLTLGSSAVASSPGPAGDSAVAGSIRGTERPWSRWLAEDLELTRALTMDCVDDGIPLPSAMGLPAGTEMQCGVESLAARYSAMSAVVSEMLERTDPVRHPMAAARLAQTHRRCEQRLNELLGKPEPGHPARQAGRHSHTAGHYLG